MAVPAVTVDLIPGGVPDQTPVWLPATLGMSLGLVLMILAVIVVAGLVSILPARVCESRVDQASNLPPMVWFLAFSSLVIGGLVAASYNAFGAVDIVAEPDNQTGYITKQSARDQQKKQGPEGKKYLTPIRSTAGRVDHVTGARREPAPLIARAYGLTSAIKGARKNLVIVSGSVDKAVSTISDAAYVRRTGADGVWRCAAVVHDVKDYRARIEVTRMLCQPASGGVPQAVQPTRRGAAS